MDEIGRGGSKSKEIKAILPQWPVFQRISAVARLYVGCQMGKATLQDKDSRIRIFWNWTQAKTICLTVYTFLCIDITVILFGDTVYQKEMRVNENPDRESHNYF